MTSFEFNWAKNPQTTGKVFARKRTNQPDGAPTQSKVIKLPPTQKAHKTTPNEEETEPVRHHSRIINRKESEAPNSTGLVKRKHNKDKAIAKASQVDNVAPIEDHSASKNANHSLFSVGHKNVYVNTRIPGKSVVEKVFTAGKSFATLDIHKYLVSNLTKNSFTTLTNVQEKSIPLIMSGENVLIRSQTGSGKTLAYAVPILNALQGIEPRLQRSNGVQAIIVVPTRELALQTHEIFGKINTFQWIVVGHLCGGENRNTEKNRLRKGAHILIATPGRLLDHILHTASFKLDNVRCLVLDEADRLLDMGFKKDIVRIVEELDQSKTNATYDPLSILKGEYNTEVVPVKTERGAPLKEVSNKNRQTILLSATLTKGIGELADFTMKEHVYVDALDDFAKPDCMVIPSTVKQEFIVTHVKHRLFTLSALILAKQSTKIFVFMATGQMVDYHYELFTRYLAKMPVNRGKLKSGNVLLLDDIEDYDEDEEEEEESVMDAEFFKLHGSMDQSARKAVFTAFRAVKKGVLLCTDVAARGVDVPEADCIVQYTGPQSDEDYLHRVGRTGRAGKFGTSYIFLTHEEQEFVTRLQQQKVFLKERSADEFLSQLCTTMEEGDVEKAATALQRRYETAVAKDNALHRLACFAYSSWSRFYNTYPTKLRQIFNFKDVNLGHYVTSFAIRDTPSQVAKVVRGQVTGAEPRRLNKKLSIHGEEAPKSAQKRKAAVATLMTTSEYSSGLPDKKKKKKRKK